ncbi:MAG: 3-phosphoshikimate 1-carboxyvinyltransferase [Acidobacteriota bacterium]
MPTQVRPSPVHNVRISSCRALEGEFRVPGDKSISHRSAMIAAISSGTSYLINYSSAQDCQNTIACLLAMGAQFEIGIDAITVEGVGLAGLHPAAGPLDSGNSGSTIRLLSGILAGQPFPTIIDGDQSLRQRPMQRIIDPLIRMGATVEAREGKFAPLKIAGGALHSIVYIPPVASAQVKSAVLLAGLFADGTTTVVETTPTRDHTEIMLRECSARLTVEGLDEGTRISVTRSASLRPLGDYVVAGDISSAAFFLVAGLLVPNSQIRLKHIGVNPSRKALLDVLLQVGGDIQIENQRSAHGEAVADLVARTSSLSGDLLLSGAIIANLIDEIPILAVAATQLDGKFTVRGAGELRVKESDRIRSIVDNLRRMRVEMDEFDDGFELRGPQQLKGAELSSFGDHRIAMAFTVAGLIAKGDTTIRGADAAAVSLPEFFDLLNASGASITESS